MGQFLDCLLKNHALPDRCLYNIGDLSSIPRHQNEGITPYMAPLYFCSNWSQIDFQCLIFRIFHGIPEAYQMFRCQATTTEEELNLFFRRTQKHVLQYLMLDINKLPLKLQEVRKLSVISEASEAAWLRLKALCILGS